MTKKRISVQIEGRNYALITADDEKYVQSVAAEVVKHIRKAAANSKQLDTRDCAVLAALDFCDDRNKSIKKNKDFVEKADKIIHQTNDLNKMCSEYKEKLAEAINENTKLVKHIKVLNEQLRSLASENDSLRTALDNAGKEEPEKTEDEKTTEKMMGYVPMEQYSLFDEEKND